MNDPFSVLGVSSSATEDEIKAAYRKLAKKYHPDLNPGDATAEKKMREVNEAYTQALQIKKGGGSSSAYGPGSSRSGAYENPFGYSQQSNHSQNTYNTRYETRDQQYGNPFGAYGFDPFADFFGGQSQRRGSDFRRRAYSHPDMQTVDSLIREQKWAEAIQLLNRIPRHDADWHALYARADMGMGNRISALDHARSAVQMSPDDAEFQQLLNDVESNRQNYQQSRARGGYDFRTILCGNPCLTCFAANMLINCCCGRAFWC